jgi:hypothetical protein
MPDSATPTAVCGRLAAPDRHVLKGPVHLGLFPFFPRRPASTIHTQPTARATKSNI